MLKKKKWDTNYTKNNWRNENESFRRQINSKRHEGCYCSIPFNEFITSKLIGGAEDCLLRHGAESDNLTLVWVPGAFEIPLAAQKLAKSGKYDAVVCVGAVIRGATPHFDYVCMGATQGITQLNASGDVPVIYGLITTNTMEQAGGSRRRQAG